MNEAAMHFPIVCFGEVNWNIFPGGTFPGGPPLHLVYHLRRLGIQPAIITKAGLDGSGKRLVELLETWDISTDFFQLDNILPTGKTTVTFDGNNQPVYQLPQPAAWDNITWDDAFVQLLAKSRYFVYGSVAARNTISRQTLYNLLEIAPCRVLDLNLRTPHYSRDLIQYLLGKTDLLKLNIAELELITGWFTHYFSVEDRVKLLQEKFRVSKIIVTKGSAGSFFYFDGNCSEQQGFHLSVDDTVGSSEAFLAGLLYKLMYGASSGEAHVFADAISLLIASKPGACPHYSLDEINNIVAGNNRPSLQT